MNNSTTWFVAAGLLLCLGTSTLAQPIPQEGEIDAVQRQDLTRRSKTLDAEVVELNGRQEYKASLQRAEQSLQIRRRLYPRDRYPTGHPDLVKSLTNLGMTLKLSDDLTKAEPYRV